MKKTLIILALLAGSIAIASTVVRGWGKKVTATTTPVEMNVGNAASDSADWVLVTVTDGEVRFMLNTTTNNFVASNALCVTSGYQQPFHAPGTRSICYGTETNTADVIFNFQ